MFWLTDDVCRVPVEIRSKILVGSLVAELVDYSNERCDPRLPARQYVAAPADRRRPAVVPD